MAKALWLVEKSEASGLTVINGLRSVVINSDDGGTTAQIISESVEQANTLGMGLPTGYFDSATRIDNLTTGPLQDDKDCYLFLPNGAKKIEGS